MVTGMKVTSLPLMAPLVVRLAVIGSVVQPSSVAVAML